MVNLVLEVDSCGGIVVGSFSDVVEVGGGGAGGGVCCVFVVDMADFFVDFLLAVEFCVVLVHVEPMRKEESNDESDELFRSTDFNALLEIKAKRYRRRPAGIEQE